MLPCHARSGLLLVRRFGRLSTPLEALSSTRAYCETTHDALPPGRKGRGRRTSPQARSPPRTPITDLSTTDIPKMYEEAIADPAGVSPILVEKLATRFVAESAPATSGTPTAPLTTAMMSELLSSCVRVNRVALCAVILDRMLRQSVPLSSLLSGECMTELVNLLVNEQQGANLVALLPLLPHNEHFTRTTTGETIKKIQRALAKGNHPLGGSLELAERCTRVRLSAMITNALRLASQNPKSLEMESIFNQWIEKCKGDGHAWNTYLAYHIQRRHHSTVRSLLDQMSRRKIYVTPRNGRQLLTLAATTPDRVWLEELLEQREVLHSSITDTDANRARFLFFCQTNQPKKALELIPLHEESGACGALVASCIRVGEYDLAEIALKQQKGMQPNEVDQLRMRLLCGQGRMEAMKERMNVLIETAPRREPEILRMYMEALGESHALDRSRPMVLSLYFSLYTPSPSGRGLSWRRPVARLVLPEMMDLLLHHEQADMAYRILESGAPFRQPWKPELLKELLSQLLQSRDSLNFPKIEHVARVMKMYNIVTPDVAQALLQYSQETNQVRGAAKLARRAKRDSELSSMNFRPVKRGHKSNKS